MSKHFHHLCIIFLLVLVLCAPHAYGTSTVINAFNSGEISPFLQGRIDVKKYYSGCQTLENMVVLPHGGVTKRPGTYYTAAAKSDYTACRLVAFEYSTEQAYILEFGDLYIRFYKDGGQILSGDDPYEISSPYNTDDLFALQFAQSADVLYIVGSDYPPYSLTRSGHTSWTLSEIEFEGGPFLELNTEVIAGTAPVAASNVAPPGSEAESGTTRGTATGTVAGTTDEDYDTFRQRRGYTTIPAEDARTVKAEFTIVVTLASTIPEIAKLKYWIDWSNDHYLCYNISYSRVLSCEVKYGGDYYVVSTNTNPSVTVEGPWYDVTHIKLRLYTETRGTSYTDAGWVEAIVKLFEFEAWTSAAPTTETAITIDPTNADTFERLLDNAAAVDQGGTPNIVRIPSTGHGFLASDYVTILGTTNYDGVYEISAINDVDTFDIEVAFTAETFGGTESAASEVVLTATNKADVFDANHVGALWQLIHTVATTVTEDTFTDVDDVTSSITIQRGRNYDFTVTGTWAGAVSLQRSYDGTTWKDIVSTGGGSADSGGVNIIHTDTEEIDDAIYRAKFMEDNGGTVEIIFTARTMDVEGIARITQFIDPCNVKATIEYTLGSAAATSVWAEGAWSVDEGYPSCIALYEERQIYASTTNSPQTIWFSQTDDWDNFLLGADDTDAMTFAIAADQVNAIVWLVPQTALLMGTTGGEWVIGSSSPTEPLTPTNVMVRRQSTHGCAATQPVGSGSYVLYLQRQAQKIRQLRYAWEQDTWISPDLTLVSEHITGDGITQLALQKNPYPILWGVREDGALVGVTLEETQEVIGWHHHEFGGDVESAATIPGTSEDELWLSIRRDVNGLTVRYIEQMQPFDWGTDQEDAFLVDSGLTYDGGVAIVFTNVTKANPAVLTAEAHGLADGSQIRIIDVVGMVELNHNVYSVGTVVDANNFQLRDKTDALNITSLGFTAYTSGGTATPVENTFTTLSHLETEAVIATGDGGYAGTYTVASDTVTLGDFYNTVHIGVSYTAKVQPMKLAIAASPGVLFATTQRITDITLRLHESLACDVGTSWSVYDSHIFRDASDPLEAPPPLYSGDKYMDFSGDYEKAGNIYIQSRLPVPFTLLALRAEFEVYQ